MTRRHVAPVPRPLAGPAGQSPPQLARDWERVRSVVADAEDYYVTSVGSAGAPHIVPVLGVWVDEHLHIATDPRTRKARHWRQNPRTAVLVAGTDLDVTVEGTVTHVHDEAVLARVAAGYPQKYPWWHPYVEDGAFYAEESDVPLDVLRISPRVAFGFGKDDGFSGTRWDFPS